MPYEHIYPLPIDLAREASTRPALHAALKTLGHLGYSFRSLVQSPGVFLAASPDYPTLQIHINDPTVSFLFTWRTEDCEDERVRDPFGVSQGQEAALRAVAASINARRALR